MDDELAHLAESLRQPERLEERAADLRTAVAEASVRLRQASARLSAEKHALQRRAGFSLARLLMAGRGARDETLFRKHAYVRAAQHLAQGVFKVRDGR